MAKSGTRSPLPNNLKPSESVDREQEIEDALESVEDMTPESIGDLCKKLHLAALTKGFKLSKDEKESLKMLTQKCVPDAPKQINLDAKVRTESVILQFLEGNILAKEHNLQSIQEHIDHEQLLNAQIIPALAEELGIPK